MGALIDDPFSKVPQGTAWCPECNGYGSSLFEETERCTRCGGSGLVMVANEREQESNGGQPRRLGRAE
jgi:DnaJ-class molecular chaperone